MKPKTRPHIIQVKKLIPNNSLRTELLHTSSDQLKTRILQKTCRTCANLTMKYKVFHLPFMYILYVAPWRDISSDSCSKTLIVQTFSICLSRVFSVPPWGVVLFYEWAVMQEKVTWIQKGREGWGLRLLYGSNSSDITLCCKWKESQIICYNFCCGCGGSEMTSAVD